MSHRCRRLHLLRPWWSRKQLEHDVLTPLERVHMESRVFERLDDGSTWCRGIQLFPRARSIDNAPDVSCPNVQSCDARFIENPLGFVLFACISPVVQQSCRQDLAGSCARPRAFSQTLRLPLLDACTWRPPIRTTCSACSHAQHADAWTLEVGGVKTSCAVCSQRDFYSRC